MLAPSWTRSIFVRVFAHGLLVLLASGLTFSGLAAVFVRPVVERQLFALGSWAAPQVCSQLTAEGKPTRAPGFAATAYSADGRLIRSLVSPPLPPLAAHEVARLRVEKALALSRAGPVQAFWCERGNDADYVELGPPPPPLGSSIVLTFSLVVLVVGLASIPFARSIVRPIARLVTVTQAFGRGELAARSDIERSDEVGELVRAFNQMAGRLQRVILAEHELLANVSHELRTPLARIRVVLEIALENPPRAANLLREIGEDLGELERLVETIMETMQLDMSAVSLSGGALPAHLEPTDVVDVMKNAVERFRATYRERKVELQVSGSGHVADADARLVRRLLDNLLDNARKYSDQDSLIILRIEREPADDAAVLLEVIDHGIGIADADLPHVFEPFFRSAAGRSRGTRGAGLGLALAKRIVDAHGGRLVVTSDLGVGTRVSVSLRRSRGSPAP